MVDGRVRVGVDVPARDDEPAREAGTDARSVEERVGTFEGRLGSERSGWRVVEGRVTSLESAVRSIEGRLRIEAGPVRSEEGAAGSAEGTVALVEKEVLNIGGRLRAGDG
jgi:hypothetical protein